MKSAANKPSHVTRGDVFDDLGFSRSEASALKVKAELLDAILQEIEDKGYTQSDLVDLLDEYQPAISNLMRGKIAKVSIEKLLAYSDRLRMRTKMTVIRGPRVANRRSRHAHSRAAIA